MSFCPTNDIHSVYLDNELPEVYKAEYEAHIAVCPECQKKLNQLKALKNVLKKDSDSITPSEDFLDKSYDRLLVKMAYSKNTGKSNSSKGKKISYVISAAAAAFVFALIVPLRMNNGNIANPVEINPVISSIQNSSMVAGTSVINPFQSASSIIQGASVSNRAGNRVSASNVSFNSGRSVILSGNIDEAVLSSKAQKAASISAPHEMIRNVEVITPDFVKDETISIRITVPGVNATPIVTEIALPVEVLSGRY